MSKIENGGPAWPVAHDGFYKQGMTLRDWFAGQALIGILSGHEDPTETAFCAELAYKLADAMIAERDRT